MRKLTLLTILLALSTIFTIPTKSEGAFIIGMASCTAYCGALSKVNGRTDCPKFDACAALCRVMLSCNTFTYEACANACRVPAQGGGYIGYYGGTVPCLTACGLMFTP